MKRSLTVLFVCAALSCGFGRRDAVPEHLHVLVDRLPQCPYGVGYEQPLRVDLLDPDGRVAATTYHSGTYLGEASLQVPLHAPEALPGRYTIRFGRCPSLLEDPRASVACEDPEWVSRMRRRLTPAGMANPQVVEYYRLRAECLPEGGAAPIESPGGTP